ncbi:MAG: hypothetical protein WD077_09555 [Bacteroidia bacterium]
MKTLLLFSACLYLFFTTACRKEEPVVKKVYMDTVITGNPSPPFHGVTTIQVQNYVNKLYIDLLGREPVETEMTEGVNTLKSGSLSEASRLMLVRSLFEQDEYFQRLFVITSDKMLEGVDSSSFQPEMRCSGLP